MADDPRSVMRNSWLGDGLRELASFLPSGTEMVEIGSYAGSSAQIFLGSGRVKSFVAVDPWDETLFEELVSRHGVSGSEVKRCFVEDIMGKHPNVQMLQMTSAKAFEFVGDRMFDFVYIDGDHAYESARQDIGLWRQRVRPGGLIGGHDYCGVCPGVMRAVDEAFGKPHKIFEDHSWLVQL